MTPNRITRLLISTRSLQNLHCLLSSCTLVNDRHQSGSHTRRIRMLDNISTIDNTGSALLHQLFGTFENFLLGSPPASSDENRYSGSHFNNSVILLDIVTGIGLYDVGTEFNGLSDKRKDLLDRAIYHITATLFIGLHHQRLDHQGHPVTFTFRLQFRHIRNTLMIKFGLLREKQQVDYNTACIEGERLLDRSVDELAEQVTGQFLSIHIGNVRPENQGGFLPSGN